MPTGHGEGFSRGQTLWGVGHSGQEWRAGMEVEGIWGRAGPGLPHPNYRRA